LQKLNKEEEQKVQRYKTAGFTISEAECVNGVALSCNPCKKDYNVIIAKHISKMFFMHGKPYTQDTIMMFLESLTETYKYETPQTIIKFLQKAGNGDFGKFYGDPDIGTIREWFADFLEQTIIPARERLHQTPNEKDSRGQERSLAEYIAGSKKTGAIHIPNQLKRIVKS
jgi:hypothetical protein